MTKNFSYDSISDAYDALVVSDPSKKFVQFPWALSQCPSTLKYFHVLDIGCGEGRLARMLSNEGAKVTGYDNSPSQIQHALEKSNKNTSYLVADAWNVSSRLPNGHFDLALSVCALHYAEDRTHLEEMFRSTYVLVKPGGFFSVLVSNPDFKRFGQVLYNRRYEREKDGNLRVDFLVDGNVSCSAIYTDFQKKDYEQAAQDNGWVNFTWTPVKVSPEGLKSMGAFWDDFETDCPYASFRIEKPSSE